MYSQIAANKRKTIFLMFLFIVLVTAIGWLFSMYLVGDHYVTIYVLIGAFIYVLISYYSGSKMALGLNGAKQIEKRDNPRLYRIVENLAISQGMPTPKIYLINDPAPNAFATGRDPKHAIVGATTGLLDIMDDQELEGVMAHEIGHVKNYDIRVSLIAFALVAVVAILADILLRMTIFGSGGRRSNGGNHGIFIILGIAAAILAPLIATLIQLSISRQREYLADATGALTTRYPEGLARALAKIRDHGSVMRVQNSSTAHMFFSNPLKKSSMSGLFSTHPPVAERIKRLHKAGEKA